MGKQIANRNLNNLTSFGDMFKLIFQGGLVKSLNTFRDVENFVASGGSTGGSLPPQTSFSLGSELFSGDFSDTELTNMRKTIAKRLQASKQVGQLIHFQLN